MTDSPKPTEVSSNEVTPEEIKSEAVQSTELVSQEVKSADVTVVGLAMPLVEKTKNMLRTLLLLLIPLMILVLFFWQPVLDASFGREVIVRSQGYTFGSDSLVPITEATTPKGDYTITALKPDGKGGEITVRVEDSFLARTFVQRQETFGQLNSVAFTAKENKCPTMIFKVSGVTIKVPFFKRYPVLQKVYLNKACKPS